MDLDLVILRRLRTLLPPFSFLFFPASLLPVHIFLPLSSDTKYEFTHHSSCSTVASAAAACSLTAPAPPGSTVGDPWPGAWSSSGCCCCCCSWDRSGLGAGARTGGLKKGSPSSSASSCMRKVSQSSINCSEACDD